MNLIFLFLNFPNIEIFSEIYALSFAKKKTSDLESLFFYLVSPFKKAGKSQYNSLLLEALEVAPSYMERIQRRLKTQNRHE